MDPSKISQKKGKKSSRVKKPQINKFNYGKMIQKELLDLRNNKITFGDNLFSNYGKKEKGSQIALSSIISKKKKKRDGAKTPDNSKIKGIEVKSTFEVSTENKSKSRRMRSPRKASLDRKKKRTDKKGRSKTPRNIIEIKSGKVRKNLVTGKKGSAKKTRKVKKKSENVGKRQKTPKIYKNKRAEKTPNKKKKGSNLKNKSTKSANRNKKSGKTRTPNQKTTKGKKKGSKAKLNSKNASPKRKDLGQPGPGTEKRQGENTKWLQEELKKVTEEKKAPLKEEEKIDDVANLNKNPVESSNLKANEGQAQVETEEIIIRANETQDIEIEASPGDEKMERILRSKLRSFEPKKIELQIANSEKFPSRSGEIRSRIEEAVLKAGRGGKVDVNRIMGGMKGFFNNLLFRR